MWIDAHVQFGGQLSANHKPFGRQFDAGVATMKNEAKPRVYDILAKAFAQEDVRTCFALLGDANMN